MIRNCITFTAFLALVSAIFYGFGHIPAPLPGVLGLAAALLLLFVWRPLWIKYGRGQL